MSLNVDVLQWNAVALWAWGKFLVLLYCKCNVKHVVYFWIYVFVQYVAIVFASNLIILYILVVIGQQHSEFVQCRPTPVHRVAFAMVTWLYILSHYVFICVSVILVYCAQTTESIVM